MRGMRRWTARAATSIYLELEYNFIFVSPSSTGRAEISLYAAHGTQRVSVARVRQTVSCPRHEAGSAGI